MTKILTEARRKGITRLCHFTMSGNFFHILDSGRILPSNVPHNGRRPDDSRLDGRLDKVCCSLEYPNVWYFARARSRDEVFRDWVVLTLDLEILGTPGVEFSARNAADRLAEVGQGMAGFEALFRETVGAKRRCDGHPGWWPTDDQAEVLVPEGIPLSMIKTVIVRSAVQAEREKKRFDLLGVECRLPFVVAPKLFTPRELSAAVRSGRRVAEIPLPGD
ncbi:DarT ssDNA thymidine ADP-ribosyltransferase family protein [Nocardia wallacei]|uniref:DarT ssDNA thymidine ADP-ribosyltransferase family protein n=1 Tax=Nocardia wallacei TaxID=480035 RepID=UPI0024558CFA|nr:DarT ssDNA thymidine ADP-ribosyltransferase family protein [Nocardia wallacei]